MALQTTRRLPGSVLGLLELFNNAVEWLDYIQLVQSFGIAFQTSLLKIDVVGLRLSRWGRAIGIGDNITDTKSLPSTALTAEELKNAEELLGMIVKLMDDAKKMSDDYVRDLKVILEECGD